MIPDNTLYNHTAQIRKEFLNISNKIDALQNKVMTIKSSNSTNNNVLPIGTTIELRISDGYIQWSTGDTWNNLLSIAELQGSDGQDGTDGTNGTDGIDGIDGADGSDGANGVGVPIGGTTGQLLTKTSNDDYDTEWTDAGSGGGGDSLIYVVKNADQAKSNDDTLADDNTLKFTTEANTKYMIIIMAGYTIGSSSSLRLQFGHTGTTTSFRVLDLAFLDDYGSDSRYNITNINDAFYRTYNNNNGRLAIGTIFLDVGSSGGTFSLKWAQNTSYSGTTTIRAGSYLAYKAL